MNLSSTDPFEEKPRNPQLDPQFPITVARLREIYSVASWTSRFELEPNTELLVIVASRASSEEREDWVRQSLERLAQASGDDEPGYSLNHIIDASPEYEGM